MTKKDRKRWKRRKYKREEKKRMIFKRGTKFAL
jgi:hypothetical protein